MNNRFYVEYVHKYFLKFSDFGDMEDIMKTYNRMIETFEKLNTQLSHGKNTSLSFRKAGNVDIK